MNQKQIVAKIKHTQNKFFKNLYIKRLKKKI